jgi:hypothetical protein
MWSKFHSHNLDADYQILHLIAPSEDIFRMGRYAQTTAHTQNAAHHRFAACLGEAILERC